MNWLTMLAASGTTSARHTSAISSVVLRYRRHALKTGIYSAWVKRVTGLRASGRKRPRMNSGISTGTSVTARMDEKPIASVLVRASGLNIRPSCASSRKIGRNDTMMMRSEKNNAGPTCCSVASRIRRRSFGGIGEEVPMPSAEGCACRSACAWRSATAIGMVRIGISAERKCQRNRMMTRLTTIASSIRSRTRLWTEA